MYRTCQQSKGHKYYVILRNYSAKVTSRLHVNISHHTFDFMVEATLTMLGAAGSCGVVWPSSDCVRPSPSATLARSPRGLARTTGLEGELSRLETALPSLVVEEAGDGGSQSG